jgi:hypothetical protein
LLGFGLERGLEVDAVFDAAGGVGAVVDGGLEYVDVPAVDEIGVVAVAYGVSVRRDRERERREERMYRLGRRWTIRIGQPCP